MKDKNKTIKELKSRQDSDLRISETIDELQQKVVEGERAMKEEMLKHSTVLVDYFEDHDMCGD